MRIAFFNRKNRTFIDAFNIIGGELDNDYVEVTTSSLVIESNLGSSGIMLGDWAVVSEDNSNKIVYAGFIKEFTSTDPVKTELVLSNWRGALIGEFTFANVFTDTPAFSGVTDWETLAQKTVSESLTGAWDGALISFLRVDTPRTVTSMTIRDGKATNMYNEGQSVTEDDITSRYVTASRLDIIDHIFKVSSVVLDPDVLEKQSDGTYKLVMVPANHYWQSNTTTKLLGPADAVQVINIRTDSDQVNDLDIKNRMYEVMEANSLEIVVFNDTGITGTYWYWRKLDGTVTSDSSDPDIITPAKSKSYMKKESDGFGSESTRKSFAQTELGGNKGDFDVSFTLSMADNDLINGYTVKGDGTADNPFVYTEKPTTLSNIFIGATWKIYDKESIYTTQLTGYRISFDDSKITPLLGGARSSMKFLVRKFVTGLI